MLRVKQHDRILAKRIDAFSRSLCSPFVNTCVQFSPLKIIWIFNSYAKPFSLSSSPLSNWSGFSFFIHFFYSNRLSMPYRSLARIFHIKALLCVCRRKRSTPHCSLDNNGVLTFLLCHHFKAISSSSTVSISLLFLRISVLFVLYFAADQFNSQFHAIISKLKTQNTTYELSVTNARDRM